MTALRGRRRARARRAGRSRSSRSRTSCRRRRTGGRCSRRSSCRWSCTRPFAGVRRARRRRRRRRRCRSRCRSRSASRVDVVAQVGGDADRARRRSAGRRRCRCTSRRCRTSRRPDRRTGSADPAPPAPTSRRRAIPPARTTRTSRCQAVEQQTPCAQKFELHIARRRAGRAVGQLAAAHAHAAVRRHAVRRGAGAGRLARGRRAALVRIAQRARHRPADAGAVAGARPASASSRRRSPPRTASRSPRSGTRPPRCTCRRAHTTSPRSPRTGSRARARCRWRRCCTSRGCRRSRTTCTAVSHAWLQQNPCAQKLESHSPAVVHAAPVGLSVQMLALQMLGATQSVAAVVQLVRQAPAVVSQVYFPHGLDVAAPQTPAPLHVRADRAIVALEHIGASALGAADVLAARPGAVTGPVVAARRRRGRRALRGHQRWRARGDR